MLLSDFDMKMWKIVLTTSQYAPHKNSIISIISTKNANTGVTKYIILQLQTDDSETKEKNSAGEI